MKSVAPDTLWRATVDRTPIFSSLASKEQAQVAIVGAGFTGLSAALHLARRGVEVLVLEAYEIGWGASGRNAGFVAPNFSKADPATVMARLGETKGRMLLNLVGRGGDRVFEISRELGLGRHAEQNGWLQPAHSPAAADMLRRRVAAWQALGRPVTWLDANEAAKRIGMDIYHGALADRSGGMINPLAYATAVAKASMAAGARIVEHMPVASVKRSGDRFALATPGGTITADTVLLCTNASAEGEASRLARSIIPLQIYQIATEPLDSAEIQRIAPRREPVSDTRSNIFTFRFDVNNRLISGGMAIAPIAAEQRMGARIVRRLASELRLSRVPRVAYVWRGAAAITSDFLPRIFRYGPGFLGAIGCNGRGIAMTTMLGEVLADAATGTALDALPVPVSEPHSIPMRFFARLAPSAYLIQGIWHDWRTTQNPSEQDRGIT